MALQLRSIQTCSASLPTFAGPKEQEYVDRGCGGVCSSCVVPNWLSIPVASEGLGVETMIGGCIVYISILRARALGDASSMSVVRHVVVLCCFNVPEVGRAMNAWLVDVFLLSSLARTIKTPTPINRFFPCYSVSSSHRLILQKIYMYVHSAPIRFDPFWIPMIPGWVIYLFLLFQFTCLAPRGRWSEENPHLLLVTQRNVQSMTKARRPVGFIALSQTRTDYETRGKRSRKGRN